MEPALTDPTRGAIRVTTSTRRGATWASSRRRSRTRWRRRWPGIGSPTLRILATRTARKNSRWPAHRLGLLLLGVAPVEDIGGQEGDDDKSRRPAEARAERVVWRQVDEYREPADRRKHQDDQRASDRAVAREEQLELELPRRTVTLVHVPGRRDMSAHTLTPAHAVASTSRQALEWNALDLPLTRRWHLERLPDRLVAVPHVCDVREHAKGQPSHEDERRVGDVFEEQLREDCADEKRADQREDRDAVASELYVPR